MVFQMSVIRTAIYAGSTANTGTKDTFPGNEQQTDAADAADVPHKYSVIEQEATEPAPVKLALTWVKVPPVELDCSRRNMNSTASPRGGVGC
jgi:hypothetical protein